MYVGGQHLIVRWCHASNLDLATWCDACGFWLSKAKCGSSFSVDVSCLVHKLSWCALVAWRAAPVTRLPFAVRCTQFKAVQHWTPAGYSDALRCTTPPRGSMKGWLLRNPSGPSERCINYPAGTHLPTSASVFIGSADSGYSGLAFRVNKLLGRKDAFFNSEWAWGCEQLKIVLARLTAICVAPFLVSYVPWEYCHFLLTTLGACEVFRVKNKQK